jgi:sporulation protein YlmC with PRC-barrel domain
MTRILAENLSGKTVVGDNGAELGMLYNVTMDLKTGSLQDLIIDPGERAPRDPGFDRNDHGHFLVPVGDVQSVSDHIVVAR